MLSKRFFFAPLLMGSLLIVLLGFRSENYRFPLDGFRALSGTFGELRPNHFHSGIDIKTGGKSGAPLYAIEDGYVYRIKVSPYGFGKAVYLRHQDGRFSVYAHMSAFNREIDDYVYRRQMSSKQHAQEIYLSRDEIPVRRGQRIGFSGNSGSSLGPHLHFEIRDPQERIMDPLRWFKHEVPDHRKPVIQEVAFEPIDPDARVRGEFRKYKLVPTGSNGNYRLTQTIQIQGRVGLEYRAYDLLDGAGNHCGINHARLFLDGKLIYEYDLEKFAFDEKRYINLHIDYPFYRGFKRRLQKSYVEYGNYFNAYTHQENRGLIELKDDNLHRFTLTLSDAHGNQSSVSGNIRRASSGPAFPERPTYFQKPVVHHELRRQVLVLRAERAHASYRQGLWYENIFGDKKRLPPRYMKGTEMVFILPLDRFDYPRRIWDDNGDYHLNLHLREEIQTGKNNLFEQDELQLFFPYQAVFDRVHLTIKKLPRRQGMYTDIFRVGDPRTPLFKSYLVSFTPPDNLPATHLVVAHRDGSKWEYVGSQIGEAGNVYASTREFGDFCLMADSVAPRITPVNFSQGSHIPSSQNKLVLRVEDSFSGIDDEQVYGTLNGKWILFAYNHKYKTLTHSFSRGRPAKGSYRLHLSVRDKANNLSTREFRISL